jgi:hypothetical protein
MTLIEKRKFTAERRRYGEETRSEGRNARRRTPIFSRVDGLGIEALARSVE